LNGVKRGAAPKRGIVCLRARRENRWSVIILNAICSNQTLEWIFTRNQCIEMKDAPVLELEEVKVR
jgi:hypothetical protein